MRIKISYLFFIISCLVYAQDLNTDYVISHISVKDGLSNNYVTKVVSDSLNIKWIATENGITKYDGLNYFVIEPNEKYPGLKNENIETLFIDSRNDLWIGTKSGGLSKLEIETNKLTNYNHVFGSDIIGTLRIREILEDGDGNLWIGTHDNGLFVMNIDDEIIVKHFQSIRTKSIIKDKNDNIWVATQHNIFKYSSYDNIDFSTSFDKFISRIVEDRLRNCLWISVINENKYEKLQLARLDLASKNITFLETNIHSSYASSLFVDNNNILWLGTWGAGLYYSNRDISEFHKKDLTSPLLDKDKTIYDIVLDIHLDKYNVLWVSTSYGGIVQLKQSKGFQNLDKIVNNSVLKKGINIHSIYRDSDGIFLGSLKDGLFFGKDLHSIKQVTIANNEKINSIAKHNGAIVIGSGTSAIFLDKNMKEIGGLDIFKPTTFLSESKDVLWIGTQHNGLYKIDLGDIKNPKILEHYTVLDNKYKLESNRITTLCYDANGNMWVGTYNGIHIYDKVSKRFIHYNELINLNLPKIINTIYTDSKYVWLGTPRGLFKLSYYNDSLAVLNKYSIEDGIGNNFICGITSDSKDNLWFTTTTNIVYFNQKENTFINYGMDDGVNTSLFNLRSIYNSDGHDLIFAGGIDNLTYFNPNEIKPDRYDSELIFTHLKIDNNFIQANDTTNLRYKLNKDFSYSNTIELTHNEKSFSVGFVNNSFNNRYTSNYRYRLLGYQDDWIYLKNQNEVSFVGLSPGKYELQVSSSKDFQNWLNSKSLQIKILYAPFSSPLAFFIYALLLLTVIIGFLSIFIKQKYLRNKVKLLNLAREKEHDLNEAKLTFFTNISHEFRTPLTLILGPVKEMLSSKNLNSKLTDKLITVEKNAVRLINLTNELLDFRKAEHGLLKLNQSKGNIVRFSNEVFMYFKEQALSKNINFKFKSDNDKIETLFDRNKMEVVLCNLISNAIKYTDSGGNIELEIKTDESNCIISITDDGLGIHPKYRDKIFDRFYQIKNTNTAQVFGSGIGLSFTKTIVELHKGTIELISNINKGSKFVIKLPYTTLSSSISEKEDQAINSDNIKNYKKLHIEENSLNPKDVKNKNTVLIVDDNKDIRKYIKTLLKQEYSILEAADGEEGVNVAIEKMPDLILCDIMMPKKDGLTVCKELKSQVITSHIPIIMLTARSSNMFEIEGLKTGADDFISKPFDPQIVKARIESALQNRLKLREHFLNIVRFEPSTKKDDVYDPESVFLNKAITLIEENLLDDNFGVESLMDELHMSRSTLYRKIKSLTGLSLTGLIRSIRLKHAAEIILTENHKLSYVSTSVGFNDYKYFRESFLKQFGCLPSEYKNSFNKE